MLLIASNFRAYVEGVLHLLHQEFGACGVDRSWLYGVNEHFQQEFRPDELHKQAPAEFHPQVGVEGVLLGALHLQKFVRLDENKFLI